MWTTPKASPWFRAIFEVLPEFDLGSYKALDVEVEAAAITDADVEKTLEESRRRAATFVPVEGRAIAKGRFRPTEIDWHPRRRRRTVQADSVLCHIGAEETLESFTENLAGRANRRSPPLRR